MISVNQGAIHCGATINRPPTTTVKLRKIAVLRALQLGDLLLAVPAFRALRAEFPYAEITLIGLPWAAAFVQRFAHYVDRFVEFAGYPGIEEVPVQKERTAQFLAEQQAYGYDLVIQMHGSGRVSDQLAVALGGQTTAGYYEQTPPAGLSLGRPYPNDWPEVLRNLGLAQLLGCRHLDPTLEFPLLEEDRAEVARLLPRCRADPGGRPGEVGGGWSPVVTPGRPPGSALHLERGYRPWIGIHAGSRSPARRWPPEYFARLADMCAQYFNAQIVLTGATDESSTVQAVAQRMSREPLIVAGKTSLGGLAALISELDLFISNDTGPAHIADAVQTPSVTIFGPVDPRRWAALDQMRHPVVRRPVACSPCSYWTCPIDHRCLRWVMPEMVMQVVEDVMRRVPTRGNNVCNV